MNKTKLKKFEDLFLQKRETLLNPPTKPEAVQVEGGDEVDIVQGIILNEMAEKLSFREKTALKRINEALKRIKDDNFGICEECEEPIGEKRLIAIPDCNTCIFCAERQEKVAKQYRKG